MDINEVKYLIEHDDKMIELLKTRFNIDRVAYQKYESNIYNYLIKKMSIFKELGYNRN